MKSLVERQVGTRIAKMLQEVQHRQGYINDNDIARIAGQVGEPSRVMWPAAESQLPEVQRQMVELTNQVERFVQAELAKVR